jgi:glycerophosphoryl diester phosphodiesterase
MKIIGHRGARGLAPENTLLSIGHALDHHVDEIEVDVRITADNVAVLHHNRDIRVGEIKRCIATTNFGELRKIKSDLATLEEALDFIHSQCPLIIEVKPGEPIQPVVKVLRQYFASGRHMPAGILLESKSQRTLREIHQVLPDVELVVAEKWSGVKAHFRAKELGATRLAMRSWWLYRGFLKAMQRRGYKMSVYTMNDPKKVAKWQPYLDGVFTDYPDRYEKQ